MEATFGAPPLPGLNTSPTRLLTTVTPSYQPTTPFGAMMLEKKSTLDQIAEIAQKVSNVATVLKSPSGSTLQLQPAPKPYMGGAFAGLLNTNSIFSNPLTIAGAALLVVYFVKKK